MPSQNVQPSENLESTQLAVAWSIVSHWQASGGPAEQAKKVREVLLILQGKDQQAQK